LKIGFKAPARGTQAERKSVLARACCKAQEKRHGVSDLKSLQPLLEGTAKPVKTFKDYEPGFLHIDIKYLAEMPDETQRRYLFLAIDRATRWVFMRTYRDQSKRSSTDFLCRLKQAAPRHRHPDQGHICS